MPQFVALRIGTPVDCDKCVTLTIVPDFMNDLQHVEHESEFVRI